MNKSFDLILLARQRNVPRQLNVSSIKICAVRLATAAVQNAHKIHNNITTGHQSVERSILMDIRLCQYHRRVCQLFATSRKVTRGNQQDMALRQQAVNNLPSEKSRATNE